MKTSERVFEDLISTIERVAVDNATTIKNVNLWADSWRKELESGLEITEQERNLIREVMMFTIKDITGKVFSRITVQSMIANFEKALKINNKEVEPQYDSSVAIQNRFMKCFKLYKKVKADLKLYVIMRGTISGINKQKDEYALKWQSKQMRLEILKAFLEGRNPNWHFAYYLSNDEIDIRNQSYCT